MERICSGIADFRLTSSGTQATLPANFLRERQRFSAFCHRNCNMTTVNEPVVNYRTPDVYVDDHPLKASVFSSFRSIVQLITPWLCTQGKILRASRHMKAGEVALRDQPLIVARQVRQVSSSVFQVS